MAQLSSERYTEVDLPPREFHDRVLPIGLMCLQQWDCYSDPCDTRRGNHRDVAPGRDRYWPYHDRHESSLADNSSRRLRPTETEPHRLVAKSWCYQWETRHLSHLPIHTQTPRLLGTDVNVASHQAEARTDGS